MRLVLSPEVVVISPIRRNAKNAMAHIAEIEKSVRTSGKILAMPPQ